MSSLRDGARAFLIRLAAAILVRRAAAPGTYRSLLVIRIDERVGNVLLTTPLLASLRAALPGARVDLLAAASKISVAEGSWNVIPFEKRHAFTRPLRLIRQLLALRRAHYDVAIDASHWHTFSATSALLLAWTGAAIRISHDRGDARLVSTHLAPPPADEASEPEVVTKLRLLDPIAIPAGEPRLVTGLGASGPANDRMRRWLEGAGLSRVPLAGLVPGARKTDHRLPESVFASLGAEAARLGARPLVLWGPGEEGLAARVAAACAGSVAPASDVAELAALMRACRVVVTNDTGPMHLAVAVGVPTIALFNNADHARWGHAYAPNAVIPGHGRSADEILADAGDALRRILGALAT